MKTNRFTHLITAALSLAAFSTAGCAEKEQNAAAPAPPAKDVPTTTVTTTAPGPAAGVQVTDTAGPDAASARWADIKDCTYDMRAPFFSGLKQLEARVDGQVSELTARRAAMKSTADTKDWDFAMKEMENARSALMSMGEDLSKASPETWAQQKDKVGLAWVRTQEAYGKVKSSMTS